MLRSITHHKESNNKMYRYSDLLKTDSWLNKRSQILNRCKGVCERCGKSRASQVHHRYYLKTKLPWEYPDDALVALCSKCHLIQHSHIPYDNFKKSTNSADLDSCNDIPNLKARRKENNKRLSKIDDRNKSLFDKIEALSPPITDDGYILHRPRIPQTMVSLLELTLSFGIPFFYNFNSPTLINPFSGKRIFLPLYFPSLNRAILAEADDIKWTWCESKGIDVIIYRREGNVDVLVKEFIVTGMKHYENYLAYFKEREQDRANHEYLANNFTAVTGKTSMKMIIQKEKRNRYKR